MSRIHSRHRKIKTSVGYNKTRSRYISWLAIGQLAAVTRDRKYDEDGPLTIQNLSGQRRRAADRYWGKLYTNKTQIEICQLLLISPLPAVLRKSRGQKVPSKTMWRPSDRVYIGSSNIFSDIFTVAGRYRRQRVYDHRRQTQRRRLHGANIL